MILSASAVLGIVAALMTTLPPISWFSDPLFETTYSIMGALGTALVGFNVLALVVILIPYRRGERWAWYTLWMLPLLWVSQFVLLARLHLPSARRTHHGRPRPSLPKVLLPQRKSPRA